LQLYKDNPKQAAIKERNGINPLLEYNEVLIKADLYINEKNEDSGEYDRSAVLFQIHEGDRQQLADEGICD
jgi:hypothetical protein